MKQEELKTETFWSLFKQHPLRTIGEYILLLAFAAFLLFGAFYTLNTLFNSVFRRCVLEAQECVTSADSNGPTEVCWCTKGMRWFWEDDPLKPNGEVIK